MRLTRESLLKVARDTATQRARISRRIICIYLTGSVLEADPLLGGTTDIDLFFVHDSDPVQSREIIRLSEDVHLDIAHYSQSIFHQPRHLRTDPWLGPFIYNKPLVLHDTQHWFDFMQAATGAQFNQPDYTLQRARTLAQSARQLWMALGSQDSASYPEQVKAYLRAVEDAGNAIASLSGEPLTERRFFTRFPQRAQAIGHTEISARLVEMITDPSINYDIQWPTWIESWKEAFTHAGDKGVLPPKLHLARLTYYERAASALWRDHPVAALWIMMKSWTDAAAELDPDSPQFLSWLDMMQALQIDRDHFSQKTSALDHLIDMVDETLDDWGKANGISNL